MKKKKKKPLSERISKELYENIYQSIGRASMCWKKITEAGEFDSDDAIKISDELCHAVADEIDMRIKKLRVLNKILSK